MKPFFLSLLIATTLLTAAPQAVVFDFGGVMVGEPDRDAVHNFICQTLHLTEEAYQKVDRKKRTDATFWLAYAKEHQLELPSNWEDNYKLVLKNALAVRDEMYSLVDELKEREIAIALFSNIDNHFAKFLREFGLYDPFDPCILSCDIGLKKPDLEAYKILIDRLQIPAGDIVFIDDKLENVDRAKELGIDGIHFESYEQICHELKQRELI